MSKCANCGHDEIDHDYESSQLWIGACQVVIGSYKCHCEGYIEPEDVELVDFVEEV